MKQEKKADNKILRFLGFDADFKSALPSMIHYNWAVFLANGSFYIIGLFLIPFLTKVEGLSTAQAYMILGGIPYYLSLLQPNESLPQNIDRLFFAENAEMHREYKRLFKSLFKNPEPYLLIMEELVKKAAAVKLRFHGKSGTTGEFNIMSVSSYVEQ